MSLHANLSVLSSSKTRWMMAVRITALFPCPRHGCLQHITALEFENMTSKFGSDFGIIEPLCNSSLRHIQYQGARLKNENLEMIPKAAHIPTYSKRHMDALSRPQPEKNISKLSYNPPTSMAPSDVSFIWSRIAKLTIGYCIFGLDWSVVGRWNGWRVGDGVGGVGVPYYYLLPCGRRANGEHFSSRSRPPRLAMNSSRCVESCQIVSVPSVPLV